VGAGGGKAEVPSAEVPENGGDEQGEHHGEAGAAADLKDEFHGKKRDSARGYGRWR